MILLFLFSEFFVLIFRKFLAEILCPPLKLLKSITDYRVRVWRVRELRDAMRLNFASTSLPDLLGRQSLSASAMQFKSFRYSVNEPGPSFYKLISLKGVFAKNERGYRLNAKNKRFWSLLILLLSVASIRRKLLKTIHTEERSAHTNLESCNIQLGS